MIQRIAAFIWNMAEYYKINLGVLAPYIFGLIIGKNSYKINKNENKSKS